MSLSLQSYITIALLNYYRHQEIIAFYIIHYYYPLSVEIRFMDCIFINTCN